jgi:hypothetical protein
MAASRAYLACCGFGFVRNTATTAFHRLPVTGNLDEAPSSVGAKPTGLYTYLGVVAPWPPIRSSVRVRMADRSRNRKYFHRTTTP